MEYKTGKPYGKAKQTPVKPPDRFLCNRSRFTDRWSCLNLTLNCIVQLRGQNGNGRHHDWGGNLIPGSHLCQDLLRNIAVNLEYAERQHKRSHQHTGKQESVQLMERLPAHQQMVGKEETHQYQCNLELVGQELRSYIGLYCRQEIHYCSLPFSICSIRPFRSSSEIFSSLTSVETAPR